MNLGEYRSARPRKEQAGRKPSPEYLQAIVQEFVRHEALTGDENWDFFLRYVQAALTAATRHLEYERGVLNDPLKVNAEEMMLAKAKVAILGGKIEAYEEMLRLPKTLKESADKARKMIAEMERDASNGVRKTAA